MSQDKKNAVEIDDTDLDAVSGGLPAVQKIRQAATRMPAAGDVNGDGRDDIIVGATPTGHVK